MEATPTRVLVVADRADSNAALVKAAVEDALNDSSFAEVIVGTAPGRAARLLHVDLPRKIAALGAAVTPVAA